MRILGPVAQASVLQVVMCSHGLGSSGEVMTTSEVEAEVGMMMTGIMAGIRIVLKVRTLPLWKSSIVRVFGTYNLEQLYIGEQICGNAAPVKQT